jgi:hypothetical protein
MCSIHRTFIVQVDILRKELHEWQLVRKSLTDELEEVHKRLKPLHKDELEGIYERPSPPHCATWSSVAADHTADSFTYGLTVRPESTFAFPVYRETLSRWYLQWITW